MNIFALTHQTIFYKNKLEVFSILENAQADKVNTSVMLGLAESLKIIEQAKTLDEAKQKILNLMHKIEQK